MTQLAPDAGLPPAQAARASDRLGIFSWCLFETWVERRQQPIERIDQLISELKAMDTLDLSMLAVANRRLRALMAG